MMLLLVLGMAMCPVSIGHSVLSPSVLPPPPSLSPDTGSRDDSGVREAKQLVVRQSGSGGLGSSSGEFLLVNTLL